MGAQRDRAARREKARGALCNLTLWNVTWGLSPLMSLASAHLKTFCEGTWCAHRCPKRRLSSFKIKGSSSTTRPLSLHRVSRLPNMRKSITRSVLVVVKNPLWEATDLQRARDREMEILDSRTCPPFPRQVTGRKYPHLPEPSFASSLRSS